MEKILIALNLIVDLVEAYDHIDEAGITEMLYDSGFEEYEIRQVLTYLDFGNFSKINGIRYFSPSEKEKLSENAMMYLQKLHLSGTVDLMVVEEVIDRCLENDGKVDVEMVKQAFLMTLIEKKRLFTELNNDFEEFTH